MQLEWVRIAVLLTIHASLIAGKAQAGDLTGVITQTEQAGESIQLSGPGTNTVSLARPWQVVRAGVQFRIPKGARVGIVCSTRSFVRIAGPASWSLDKKSCVLGKPLKPADYALIVPQGGRLKVVQGSLALEQKTRAEEEDPLAPIVLSPRNTSLRTLRPSIAWVRIPTAAEYQIDWSGGGNNAFTLNIDKEDVTCAVGWEGLEICSIPWPADRPDLPPGQT